jgi:Radical SAM superfamily
VTTERRRSTVRVTLQCNNRCAFCAQDGVSSSERDASFEAELSRARAESDEVTFVGGEPTLDESLVAKVSAARAAGFRAVGVQTNGSRLADPRYLHALKEAGLTDVHLSIHGADAAVHDYHTGRPGSFGDIVAALRSTHASGLLVVVTTVLTRSNFRVLGSLPSFLATRGIAAWFVSVPFVAGRAATLRDRMIPRLGLALPFALQALARAHALRIPAFVVGAPLCLLGPFAAHALAGESRAYAAACDACAARSSCAGVDADYLARFDADELMARDGVTSPGSHLTALFVGAGELAPRVPAAPSRERRALPMLGKVKPAIAEAPAGTERKTGDSLQQIFPALFEGDSKG